MSGERILIRDISEQDYPLLPKLLYQAIPLAPDTDLTMQELLLQPKHSVYVEDFGGKHDFGVVAELDGSVVGAAWARLITAYGYVDDETPELVVSVLPNYRGQGIGTRLLEQLFDVLNWHSFLRVSLEVRQDNPALRLYERLGFKTVREADESLVMVKEFPPEKMTSFFAARVDIYDDHMLAGTELGKFYQNIPNWIDFPDPDLRLLDLGCGTGLELEGLFKKYPDMQVTGIDLSREMLDRLRMKYPDKPMNLVCASYFDADFPEGFDVALSIYSLHHFSEDAKRGLYQKICAALRLEGAFILGDFTVSSQELQDHCLAESIRIRAEHGLAADEFYHIDTPFTTETEIRLLKEAGFTTVNVLHQEEYASVIIAYAKASAET